MQKRNYAFDVLKVIALMGIVLAHVNPGGLVFQLRNFDVPLMIMISVWLSLKTINCDNFKYGGYIYSRVKRLITPTWIFLTIYFLIKFSIGESKSVKDIIMSYSLIGGIGYVWVIRIYIYVAILTPIINKIYKYLKKYQSITLVILMYCMYILLVNRVNLLSGITKILVTASIVDFVGYSFVVYVAILIYNLKNKDIIKVGLLFGIVFFYLALENNFVQTQNFKYPIKLYYLSYAFFISIFLYLIVDKLNKNNKLKKCKAINFISKNSMWIYLWHILFISQVNNLFTNSNLGYIYRFILLVLIATIITYIQNIMKSILRNKSNLNYIAIRKK